MSHEWWSDEHKVISQHSDAFKFLTWSVFDFQLKTALNLFKEFRTRTLSLNVTGTLSRRNHIDDWDF